MKMASAPLDKKEKERIIDEEASRLEDIIDQEIRESRQKNDLRASFRIDLVPTPLSTSLQVRQEVVRRYKAAGWKQAEFESRSTCRNEEIYQFVLEQE
jgi:hypothetical protein